MKIRIYPKIKFNLNFVIELNDNRLVMTKYYCGKFFIFDENDDYKLIEASTKHNGSINSLIQIHNEYLVSGSDTYIMILDPKDKFNCVKIIECQCRNISMMELHNGLLLALFDFPVPNISIYDPLDNYKMVRKFEIHDDITSIIQIKNGKLVSSSNDNTIKIWDPNYNFQCIQTLTGHKDSIIKIIQLNNGKILSLSKDKTIKLWIS